VLKNYEPFPCEAQTVAQTVDKNGSKILMTDLKIYEPNLCEAQF
jgi:hypothetical protein